MQSDDGVYFTNKMTLSESSAFHPGLTVAINGSYYLAWTGQDAAHSLNRLANASSSTGPTNLQYKETFSESSIAGLSVAPLANGHELFVAWTEADSARHVNVANFEGICLLTLKRQDVNVAESTLTARQDV
jgi:hypothetical protein